MTDRPFSDREKAMEIERVTSTMQRTFDRWVSAGRMTTEQARRRVSILQAVATDYRRLASQGQHKLFEDENGTN